MSEIGSINQEASRRYSEHRHLDRKATNAILRSAKMDYRADRAEYASAPDRAYEDTYVSPEGIKKAQYKAAIARDQAGLAKDIVELQVQRSGSWAAENHEQLVEAAKHSAQDAGVEIVTKQDHATNQV